MQVSHGARARATIFVVLCAVFGLSAEAHGEFKGDASLLEAVSSSYRANKQAIKWWSGEVKVEDSQTDANSKTSYLTSTASFYFSASPYQSQWNWRAGEGTPQHKENEIPFVYKFANGLIKDGKTYTVSINKNAKKEDNRTPKLIEVQPIESVKFGPQSQALPPFYYFGYRGEDLAQRFDYLRNHGNDFPFGDYTVSKDGSKVVFEFDHPELLNRYTVDLSKGGNLLQYEAEERKNGSAKVKEFWAWTWENIDGVWLPKEVAYQQTEFGEAHGNSQATLSIAARIIGWTNKTVNEPIGDENFTLEAIGVEPGDYVPDVAKKALFQSGSREMARPLPADRWRALIIAVNVAIVAVLAALLWTRSRRRDVT